MTDDRPCDHCKALTPRTPAFDETRTCPECKDVINQFTPKTVDWMLRMIDIRVNAAIEEHESWSHRRDD